MLSRYLTDLPELSLSVGITESTINIDPEFQTGSASPIYKVIACKGSGIKYQSLELQDYINPSFNLTIEYQLLYLAVEGK